MAGVEPPKAEGPATKESTHVQVENAEIFSGMKGWKAFYIHDKKGAPGIKGRMFLSPEPKDRIAVRLIQAMEQGKGYGTAMLDHAIDHARSQGKDIISDPEGGTKPAAASLFQKRGAKKIKYGSPEGYVWEIKTKHKFYRPDQARDEHGQFEDEGGGRAPFVANTPNATTKVKPGDDTFEIKTATGASITGYVKNQDFPNEGIVPSRGEIFLASVPEAERGRGTGYSLTKDAVRLLSHHGTKTVNLHATSPGGKRIVEKLLSEGIIGPPIRTSQSGKAEHPITRHAWYRPDQARDESGRFEDEGGGREPAKKEAGVISAETQPEARVTKPRAEIHKTLTTGTVTDTKYVGRGTAHAAIVTFDNGEKAVYKAAEHEPYGQRRNIDGMLFVREASGGDVAESLGLEDLVPTTDVGHGPNGIGSFQHFVPNAVDAIKLPDQLEWYDGEKDLARAAAYDYLIGNSDRHPKNWMVSWNDKTRIAGKLALIDNGLSFPNQQTETFANAGLYEEAKFRGLKIPPEAKNWIDKMPEIREKLTKRGLTKMEIDGVEGRAKRLAQISTFKDFGHFPDEIQDSWYWTERERKK